MPRTRNVVRRTLKDGSVKTYIYEGKRPTHHPAPNTVGWLIRQYENSPEFSRLRPASKKLYTHVLKLLDDIRHYPAAEVKPKHLRKIRDENKDRPGIANAFVFACGALFSWALDAEIREDYNPANRVKRLKLKERGPWPEEALDKAGREFSGGILTAFMLGLYTAQRRGDVLGLTWSAYDGSYITLTQQKTGARLDIPVAPDLKAHLDGLPRTGLFIVTRDGERPWTESGFEAAWRKAVTALGYPSLLFHGLRHSALTRLAEAGCTAPQMAAISGHKDWRTLQGYIQQAEQKKLAQMAMAKVYDFAPVQNTSKKLNEIK